MEEMIAVWFGRSWYNKDVVVVMEEGEYKIKTFKNENEEEEEIEVPSDEVESWLSRTDMSFSRFVFPRNKLEKATKKYESFIASSWEEPIDKPKTAVLKEEFLAFVK